MWDGQKPSHVQCTQAHLLTHHDSYIMYVLSTDIDQISQNLRHFDSRMGSNWGHSGFSRNQNNRGSSRAYITCIYCGLSVKMNTRKTLHGAWRSWMHLLCVCFCVCGRQKPEYPDDAITLGGIRVLGSPLYICGSIRCPQASSRFSWVSPVTGLHFPTYVNHTFKTNQLYAVQS